MKPDAYALAAEAETEHWWFVARRAILRAVVDQLLPEGANRHVLEVGCGNGGNFSLLARYGALSAVEHDAGARARASSRGLARVEQGDLPHHLPFADTKFQLIAALDVVEHVDDDAAAVRALAERLSMDGMLLVTVPAYSWLWSSHDELSHHLRRYTAGGLNTILEKAGLRVAYSSYFNSFLFPVGVAHAKLSGLFGRQQYGMQVPPRFLNAALRTIFECERLVIPRHSLPFGMSIVSCAFRA